MAATNPIGAVGRATRAHVRRLCAAAPFTPAGDAFAAAAVRLADRLDLEEVASRAAGLSKALLDAMAALMAEVGAGHDPFADELTRLSTPVRESSPV